MRKSGHRSRRPSRRSWLVSAAMVVAGLVPAGPPRPSSSSADPPPLAAAVAAGCPWRSPVPAAVVDGFRPPSHPYGPGNRGLEYGVTPGERVRAVAAGRVGFVGPVGGRRYVVVEHWSELRSTYGPLDATAVARGQTVAAGDDLGAAGAGLHLTARLGDRYIDPAPLLAGECGHPRLVAADPPDRR